MIKRAVEVIQKNVNKRIEDALQSSEENQPA